MMLLFYATVLEHFGTYLVILLTTLSLHLVLFRRHVFSLFDPLLYYAVVTEGFCVADVVFLYHLGLIEQKYFLNYVLTEAAFFAGILQFRPAFPEADPSEPGLLPGSIRPVYLVSIALFVVLNLIVYVERGIPLLKESRLEIYSAGGGWGFVTRLFDVLLVIIVYYLLETRRRRSWRIGEWLSLAAVLIVQVLSGAKSAVLGLVFIVSLHAFVTGSWKRQDAPSRRLLRRLTVAALSGFVLIAAVQKADVEVAGNEVPVLGQAAMRLVANGDAFVLSYPTGFVEDLDSSRPVSAIAKEYLAFFRLSDPERLPEHIGVQISRAFGDPNAMNQTNAKHNLFGYVYFGATGSILFSYLLGTCLGAFRYRLLKVARSGWLWGVAYIVLNTAASAVGNEWDGLSRAIIDVGVILCPLWLIMAILERQHQAAEDVAVAGN